MWHWQRQNAETHTGFLFQQAVWDHIVAIRREIATSLQTLRALSALYQASDEVTRGEFSTFAGKLLETTTNIQALEWIPLVTHARRADYEGRGQGAIPGFHLTERDRDGRLVPAAPRDAYYPVYYVEPWTGNQAAAGFDLASEPVRRRALERACDSGRLTASGPITLVQEQGEQSAFLVYLPVYGKGVVPTSVALRRARLLGFVLGVYRVGDLIEAALAQLAPRGIDFRVSDITAPGKPLLLYLHASAGSRDGASDLGLGVEHTLDVAGRQWRLIATPAAGSFLPAVSYTAWLVFWAGLVITGLLAWYVHALHSAGRRLLVVNRALDHEVDERRRTEAALKRSEGRFRRILESAADAIIISDGSGIIRIANPRAEGLFGYSADELIGRPVEILLPEALRQVHAQHRQGYQAKQTPQPGVRDLELVGRHRDGTLIPVEISLSAGGPNVPGGERSVTAIVRDISARKETAAELRRLHRTYAVLSQCNRSLAVARDEGSLLEAFCRNLVEVGGYRFAWIGYAQQDPAQSVRVMAQAGTMGPEPSITTGTWSGEGDRYSACGTAIRTGKPVVLRNIERDVGFLPWREIAMRLGFRSMIALPLEADGEPFGNFSIFATETNAFNRQEVDLLAALARNLAFGIETLRERAIRGEKLCLLREQIERDERRRFAAILHDGVAQSVQAVSLGLKRLRAMGGKGQQPSNELLNRLIDELGGVIRELRDLSHELRPLFLERLELREAVRYHCNELSERSGIDIPVSADDAPLVLDARVKEQCFLSMREALNNAVKHARATRIEVSLQVGEPPHWLTVRIRDDGVGFDPRTASELPTGLGLSMLAERAQRVGGHAEIDSAPGAGTTVTITVPLGA